MRVIELGSGRGDMSFLLAKAGAQVTLVDSSPFALRQARARFAECGLEAEYVEADLLGTQIQGDWDVSMSFGLAEHFTGEELQVILDAHTIGKLAFVSVPNALCIPYRIWKSALELTGRWPYGREKPLTKAGLREKMCEIFDDVSVFTTPLSYNLNRRIGLPVRVRWPIDTALGYQLVACGAKRVTEL